MTSTRTSRLPVRRTAAGAAVALTAALGLAAGPATPGHAAAAGWDPQQFALPWLPAPSVDGEISVTQVGTDGSTGMRTFLRDGTAAGPQYPISGKEHVWSPGGDVVSGQGVGLTHHGPTPGDVIGTRSAVRPALWSPFGDSTTESWPVKDQFMPAAKWTGNYSRTDGLIPPGAHDPGTPAVTPDGYGVVVSVPSPDMAGKRDLGLAAKGADDYPAFPRIANKKVQTPFGAPQALGYGGLDARLPVVGPDGTLAFVGTSERGTALYVDEGDGAVPVALLGGDCAGQRPAFAPSGTVIAFLVSSADCAATTLTTLARVNDSFVGGERATVVSSPAGTRFQTASWRARTPKAESERIGGADRIATAVAVSQWGWLGAEGAVLASSSAFADAVVAGPLAGTLDIPLLITGGKSLDTRVLNELKRLVAEVPAEDRVVFVVGGTTVVSAEVERTLKSNGFRVVRLAGPDRYATSVSVAKALDSYWDGDPSHFSAFVADGRNFPDALSAGPAAVQMSAAVLLSNGTSVPASVRNYIAGSTGFTKVYGVGGPAAQATKVFGSKAQAIYGGDRYSTSLQVARTFFPDGAVLGYASGEAYPDALTGGALMGALGQPLLLTRPDWLESSAREMAEAYRASTEAVLLFGGTNALTDKVRTSAELYAGNQTALWGLTSPTVENPAAAGQLGAASPDRLGAGVSRLATNQNALTRMGLSTRR